jgi:hypothetical protein
MKRILAMFVALFAGTYVQAQSVQWPSLPKSEYVAGRVATTADVEAGRAVFVAEKEGIPIGKPAKVTLPQYAWHRDGTKKVAVVVIQAEDVGPQRILGAKKVAGGYLAGLASEFELLGQEPPK